MAKKISYFIFKSKNSNSIIELFIFVVLLLIAMIKRDTAMMEGFSSFVKFLTALVELANSIITIIS